MAHSLIIRELNASDGAAFLRLMGQVHTLHHTGRPDIFKPTEQALDGIRLEEVLSTANMQGLLAEWEGEPAGLCTATFRVTESHPLVLSRKTLWIEELCVDAAWQRRGIGSALLSEMKRRGGEWGADGMELMVWGFNETARRFYEKEGMTPKHMVMELSMRNR